MQSTVDRTFLGVSSFWSKFYVLLLKTLTELKFKIWFTVVTYGLSRSQQTEKYLSQYCQIDWVKNNLSVLNVS